MAREKRNDYFAMMTGLAEYSVKAAARLEEILGDFREETIYEDMEALHAVEHEADEQRHVLSAKLLKEFITPIEREDIMAITSQIDKVTDAVEDILLKVYMFHIREIREDAFAFTALIKKCCENLLTIFQEFGNFKKSKRLADLLIEMNRLEEEGDSLYIKAVRDLHTSDCDPLMILTWTELYHRMERACDTCEQTAELVEHVILKNS